MKFFNYPSILKFHMSSVPEQFFRENINKDWDIDKKLLKHKDCPKDIYDSFVYSNCFYKRLHTICKKSKWREYLEVGLNDPDKRVRRAVYNRWFVNGTVDDMISSYNKSRIEDLFIKNEIDDLLKQNFLWILADKD